MVAGNVQGGVSLAEDRVAQGEGQRELPVGKSMQEPLHAAAIELDHAATDAGMASRAKADEAKKQAEERVGRGPENGEEAKGQVDDNRAQIDVETGDWFGSDDSQSSTN